MRVVIRGLLGDEWKDVIAEDGWITDVGEAKMGQLTGARLIDTGAHLFPGFVDVHVHGGGGADVMDASMDAFEQIATTHARHGTTALVLTTVAASREATSATLSAWRKPAEWRGADVLGFHLEGPFIHPERRGAHPAEHVRTPSPEELRAYARAGPVRILTMAPELPGADETLLTARDLGILVSLGHSAATYGEAMRAFDLGAKSATHLFNAMEGLHHRRPGLAAAALDRADAMVELILDGVHVHPALARLAMRIKGRHGVMLVTDAVSVVDMPEGRYGFAGSEVVYEDGVVRRPDGTLAGSALTMERAVQMGLAHHVFLPRDVPYVAAANAARLLGERRGRIEPGYRADLVALSEAGAVTHTIVGGRLVHSA
ncbi:N-acetylglucosamine-6-phosphate deacetylase [Alicyclobacillus acidocaldarius]|uniref:N-acetylglucosamine-6-phosphate deacetylase n=1 Tax=Alicyclobacillus acidocaldarius (strain Tc-4-1) TaxID=1048834 RepID=F8IF42_ALIAT|nr:N-acetylglucosamine-6-phosphate deacetylase [Alicyclobacillus acidocaldarius]AEJ42825.1 N-acetylglucosamine-6-phosphate deacetylase [Alicyclobacillus acidocaldarius subsp. acidocaldarius Tc-4-1]